jgi:hypothetical protein
MMLVNGDSDNIRLLRSKANRIFSYLYSPITWERTMTLIEEEASLLREKNLQLSFQLESMRYLLDDNSRLEQLLSFKRESNLNIYPARVINMGASPHLSSSLSIDIGSESGVSINDPIITPNGIIGKTVIVGKNESIVQLINDVTFRLSVRIKPSLSNHRNMPVEPDGLIRTLKRNVTSLISCTIDSFLPTITVFPIIPLGVIIGSLIETPDSLPISIDNEDDKCGEAPILITRAGYIFKLLSRLKLSNCSKRLLSSRRYLIDSN